MRSIAFAFSLLFSNLSFSQLDPAYYGLYFDVDLTESFTIYASDELSEHCFLLDWEKFNEFDVIHAESGYGECDAVNATFHIESLTHPSQVTFETDEFGVVHMYLKTPDNVDEKHFIQTRNTDYEYDSEVELPEEILFEKEDGSQLILFDEDGAIGFEVSGLLNENCSENFLSGLFEILDDSAETLIYTDKSGCVIELVADEEGVNLTEKNCESLHTNNCPGWSGKYYIKF